jgi:hypothetical protein
VSGKGRDKEDKGTTRHDEQVKKRENWERIESDKRGIKDHGHVRDRVPDPDGPPEDDE